MMIELRRELAVLGPEAFQPAHYALVREKGYIGVDRRKHVGYPLLGPGGWFASIGFASPDLPARPSNHKAAMLVTELSVWCTARGIATLPDVRPLAARQHEIAVLAGSGRTNPEIADALGISINTVKLRLKQIFERMGLDNRTESAERVRRLCRSTAFRQASRIATV